MKRFYQIFLSISLIFSLTNCQDKMTALNTNEELLTSTNPIYVFTSATQDWNNSSRGHLMGKYQGVMQLMQYIVGTAGGNEGVYASSTKTANPAPYLPYYNDYFTNYGNKLHYLIDVVIANRIDKERYQNLAAVCKILQTYEAWLVFDTNGAAPFKEGLMGLQGITTPKYDFLEDLYKEFDKTLKDQVALIVSKPVSQVAIGNNDFFYRGNVDLWAKFANSLRLKIAQRFEKMDKANYDAVVADVLSSTAGLIATNAESCLYNHNLQFNTDTWDTAILTYQFCASNAFVSYLSDNNDPRRNLLIRRNGFGTGNNNQANDAEAAKLIQYVPTYAADYAKYAKRYVGMPASPDMKEKPEAKEYINFTITAGVPTPLSFSIRGVSQIQSRFFVKNGGNATTANGERNIDYPIITTTDDIKLFIPLITYPEVCFMMAEIAEKAGAVKGGKDAATWYNDGVRNSMLIYEQWAERMKVPAATSSALAADYAPITSSLIDGYLAQPKVAYTGTSDHKLALIASQAWVNFFMRPEEGWANWKRTGYPLFKNNFTDPNPTDGTAFLEKPQSGGVDLIIPRRSVLPTPNTANVANFNTAVAKLVTQPAYLQPNLTQGRIVWDK
jgi:hypothetical protein